MPVGSRPAGSRSFALDAEEIRLEAALRAGHHREVLAEAQARAAEAPLRERRWALLALAQYQVGRQGDALRTLHQARARCSSPSWASSPGSELVALEQAILRQDPSLVRRGRPARARRRLPVPGSGALRRRRRRRASSAATGGRGVPGPARRGRRADGRRTLGQREVVAGARRRGRVAATQRPSRRGDHPGCPARSTRCIAAAGVGSGAGPGRRPVRGGRHAVRRPGRASDVLRGPRRPRRTRRRWSSRLRADRLGELSAHPELRPARRARAAPA